MPYPRRRAAGVGGREVVSRPGLSRDGVGHIGQPPAVDRRAPRAARRAPRAAHQALGYEIDGRYVNFRKSL
jgi:hypothetical protein